MVHTVARRVSWNDCDPSGRIRSQAAFEGLAAGIGVRGVAVDFDLHG